MKFGSQISPQDINYNYLKTLCGTRVFLESLKNAINFLENVREWSDIERNFLGVLKLMKKHQKNLINQNKKLDPINIEILFKFNPVFALNYQRLTHKFSRKYPEFFLSRFRSTFEIIAHRAFEPYLQNLSNDWQIRHKTDWVEIDVTICKTGEILLQHDRYHDNGQPLENMQFSEIENPITLRNLCEKWCGFVGLDNKPKLMIDVKGWNTEKNIIKNIHLVLTDFQIDKNNILIASFNQNYMIQSKKLGYKTAFITANREEHHFLHFMKHYQIDLVVLDENIACQDAVDVYHQNLIKVWVYTVNKRGRFTYLVDIGVDGIITDYPNLLY